MSHEPKNLLVKKQKTKKQNPKKKKVTLLNILI